MRKGINNRLVNNLSRFGSRQPAVALIRGSESIVSHRNEYEALSEQLRSELPRLDRIRSWELNDLDSQPVGHFFLMSLGRQAMYARELRQFVEATVS